MATACKLEMSLDEIIKANKTNQGGFNGRKTQMVGKRLTRGNIVKGKSFGIRGQNPIKKGVPKRVGINVRRGRPVRKINRVGGVVKKNVAPKNKAVISATKILVNRLVKSISRRLHQQPPQYVVVQQPSSGKPQQLRGKPQQMLIRQQLREKSQQMFIRQQLREKPQQVFRRQQQQKQQLDSFYETPNFLQRIPAISGAMLRQQPPQYAIVQQPSRGKRQQFRGKPQQMSIRQQLRGKSQQMVRRQQFREKPQQTFLRQQFRGKSQQMVRRQQFRGKPQQMFFRQQQVVLDPMYAPPNFLQRIPNSSGASFIQY